MHALPLCPLATTGTLNSRVQAACPVPRYEVNVFVSFHVGKTWEFCVFFFSFFSSLISSPMLF